MFIDKYILYPENTDEVLTLYSKAKFGDLDSLCKIKEDLYKFIKHKIIPQELENCVVYATNKYPLNKFCKKNSYILAEKISEELDLALWSGEYLYTYTPDKFYDTSINRPISVHRPRLSHRDNIIPYEKKVIFIDDSILSGTTFQVSLDELIKVTNTVYAFFIIDLSKLEIAESEINNYAWKGKSIDFLSRIIHQPGYVYTTQMMRTINSLDTDSLNKLIRELLPDQMYTLEQAYQIYFEKILSV